jgi:hypothetical protein
MSLKKERYPLGEVSWYSLAHFNIFGGKVECFAQTPDLENQHILIRIANQTEKDVVVCFGPFNTYENTVHAAWEYDNSVIARKESIGASKAVRFIFDCKKLAEHVNFAYRVSISVEDEKRNDRYMVYLAQTAYVDFENNCVDVEVTAGDARRGRGNDLF